jgi:hypothetical protein
MKQNRIKPSELIEGLLHNANVAGGHPLEQRLADTALWFHANKDSIPRDNLASRQAFLEKGFWCLLEINALLLERLRNERASKTIWVPSGIQTQGDLKKYG